MRLLLRFSVALVAFLVGITTATVFAALFGLGAAREIARPSYAPPSPPQTYGCKSQRFSRELPPLPPPPPKTVKKTQIVVHGTDGAVRVIESQTETKVERR